VARYVTRRLLQVAPVLLVTTFLIFMMVWALPGDPFAGRCGQRPCSPSYIQAQTERMHLDRSLYVQYGYYVSGLAHGDFGTTSSGDSVLTELRRAYPITLRLTLVAVAFEIVIGIGAGVVSALRKGGWFDHLSLLFSLLAISLPVFVIGFLAQYVLGLRWGVFRATVRTGAPWTDLILPGFVLAALSMAFVLRLTRASVLETLKADHVRTAVAKGLPRSLVIRRHVLRNSLVPVVTYIGADVGILIAGAIVTEGVFNIHGVGGLVFQATQRRESATVVSATTVLVLFILVVNLLTDLLYARLDPRIRYE
jgi:oligopeptide transport system permease protein